MAEEDARAALAVENHGERGGRDMTLEMTTRARGAVLPRTRPDEHAARRSLLEQVARLEEELSQLFCSTWPRKGFEWSSPTRGS